MTWNLRAVTTGDLEAVREIYAHAVRHTDATLDTEERTAEQMRAWLGCHGGRNAAVLVEEDGRVLGYGTLSPFAARGGYFPSTEISIYVHPDVQARGVGTALGEWLVDFARAAGYATVLCFITDTNIASIRLVTRNGFRPVGVIEHIGHKLGHLVNLAVYQLVFPENLARYGQEIAS
jgi:L-amino acid N-acyltransferase YncA